MRGRVALGPGREFDVIRSLLGPEAPLPPGIEVGPGDDCAVLSGGLVVSVDLTVEGIHFRRDWLSWKEAGYRAVAAALSDIAAMAAEPMGVLISLALGSGEGTGEAQALQEGFDESCRGFGVQILGGDLSRTTGPVVVDVVVLGRAEAPILRSGVQAGDEIWVTGWLGGSGGAVACWEEGTVPPADLRDAFVRPSPRIREARWLAENAGPTALIDLSDGLAGDAGHLAAASGVSLVLVPSVLPLHPGLVPHHTDEDGAVELAMRGGEDYELCLAVPPGALAGLADSFREEFHLPLTRIGLAKEGEGVFLQGPGGRVRPVGPGGFSHFPEEGVG